jgi:hypothetical protein
MNRKGLLVERECKRNSAVVTILLIAGSVLAGCTATPVRSQTSQLIFQQPSDVVQKAGLDALAVNGFEITKNEPLYVEGYRPRTWGFFCSPGGETAGVWLEQTWPAQTKVWTNTAISSFGRLCQKDWTGEILSEMNKALEKKP